MSKVLLIGGSGDIGDAIANKFKKNGSQIIMPTRKEMDLEDRGSIERFFENKKLNIDVLIHSAGFNDPKSIEELSDEDIDKTYEINVISFYKIIKQVLPVFKKKKNGYILAISSLYSFLARSKRLAYVMSKHSLNGLIKTLAIELGPYNIMINALSPGFVNTKMTRKNNDPKTIRSFKEKIPLGHLASPVDIANVAYFLCSEENTYITGQNIIVDGGYSIGGFQV